jgi:hypothetical protein
MQRQRQKDTLTTVTPAINRNLNNILLRGGFVTAGSTDMATAYFYNMVEFVA